MRALCIWGFWDPLLPPQALAPSSLEEVYTPRNVTCPPIKVIPFHFLPEHPAPLTTPRLRSWRGREREWRENLPPDKKACRQRHCGRFMPEIRARGQMSTSWAWSWSKELQVGRGQLQADSLERYLATQQRCPCLSPAAEVFLHTDNEKRL